MHAGTIAALKNSDDKSGTAKIATMSCEFHQHVALSSRFCDISTNIVDYETFSKIVNRPSGFKSLGEPEDYIRGFQVFDKDSTGFVGVGEMRYILTSLGEKMSDSEVDELLKGVNVTRDGNVNYVDFVKSILAQ